MYVAGNIFTSSCVTGMSNLISRTALEECCMGLHKLADYLAEDFFMAKLIKDQGYKVRLASFPAIQCTRNGMTYISYVTYVITVLYN